MDTRIARNISTNPKYVELVRRRSSFAWQLAIAMLVIYYAFIVIIAFAPSVLGIPIANGWVTTIGIPVGILVIISAFVLTGIYVQRANTEFDELNRQILEEAR